MEVLQTGTEKIAFRKGFVKFYSYPYSHGRLRFDGLTNKNKYAKLEKIKIPEIIFKLISIIMIIKIHKIFYLKKAYFCLCICWSRRRGS